MVDFQLQPSTNNRTVAVANPARLASFQPVRTTFIWLGYITVRIRLLPLQTCLSEYRKYSLLYASKIHFQFLNGRFRFVLRFFRRRHDKLDFCERGFLICTVIGGDAEIRPTYIPYIRYMVGPLVRILFVHGDFTLVSIKGKHLFLCFAQWRIH